MDANMKKRNELLAKTVIKGLESRNMSGYYAKDKETALKQALELIPNGSTIAMGGCMSAHEIGLVKALQDGSDKDVEESSESRHRTGRYHAKDQKQHQTAFYSGNAVREYGTDISWTG